MALATRCPHCDTTFRLDPHLLAPHDGRVRCGHCQEVFDAAHYQFGWIETADSRGPDRDFGVEPFTPWSPPSSAEVADGKAAALGVPMRPFIPENALAPQAEAPAAHAFQPDTAASATAAEAEDHPDSDLHNWVRKQATATPGKQPAAAPDSRNEPFVGRRETHFAPPPVPGPAPAENTRPWAADPEPRFSMPPPGASANLPPAADDDADAFPVTREALESSRSAAVWKIVGTLISLLLLVTLIAQVAWWQRERVIVTWPATLPLFQQACEQIGCKVSPPRDIDGLQIENSGLRQVDGPHKLELKFALHNRFDVALAYPALELTLLDEKNNVAVRRVLWPKDYAMPGTAIAPGIPAASTQQVIVRLDTGDAVAANYRVQIFYP
jgi:predicted Zn finger-like uncharacterized protein